MIPSFDHDIYPGPRLLEVRVHARSGKSTAVRRHGWSSAWEPASRLSAGRRNGGGKTGRAPPKHLAGPPPPAARTHARSVCGGRWTGLQLSQSSFTQHRRRRSSLLPPGAAPASRAPTIGPPPEFRPVAPYARRSVHWSTSTRPLTQPAAPARQNKHTGRLDAPPEVTTKTKLPCRATTKRQGSELATPTGEKIVPSRSERRGGPHGWSVREHRSETFLSGPSNESAGAATHVPDARADLHGFIPHRRPRDVRR